jgi:hypothetical protein
MPYVQNNSTGVVQSLSSVRPPNHEPNPSPLQEFDPVFAGESSDASHIIFSANDTLTHEATGEEPNLYEWIDGHLSLVNVLPDGSPVSSDKRVAFGTAKFKERINLDHVISNDGSRVFWTDQEDKELFARVNGTSTVLISGSQKTNGTGPGGTDPGGTELPVYQDASADGSYVLFTSTEELTNDANTGDATSCAPLEGDCAADLYRYDRQTGRLTDLTADAADATGSDVRGVLGSSEDGSYVYFVANGVLASGATPGNCNEKEGLCNLYVWHEGSGTRFIAKLSQASLGSGPLVDGISGNPFNNGVSAENLELRTSRVSPNGRFLAFQSEQSLTGYDNVLADGPECTGPDFFYNEFARPTCPEVFLYEAGSDHLACASCNPTGGRPIGPSVLPFRVGANASHGLQHSISGSGWTTEVYQQRYLGDSGRLFFDTVDALSPRDTNGQGDVYEYENGQARLISGGFGGEASVFFDASLSGDDVFLLTRDQLTSQDRDEAVDLYDARVGAQQDLASPPPCASSDACKPGPTPQPAAFGAPASATFSGAGNLAQSAPTKTVKHKSAKKPHKRKTKPKKKKARKNKKKARKSHKSNGQASNRRKR